MISRYLSLLSFLFISFLSANNIVGTTKGKFNVNQGNAVYNLEISTPKGTAGLKPTLSISYNSANNMNGLLGVGFSLNGLSQISKCNQTLFSEKKDTTRNYNYCLDGQKLVTKNQNDTYGSNTEYKTQIDTYSKIIKDSSGWIVYRKDGLIYEYGKTDDSKDLDVFYRVNKIKDRYNNKIDFIYDTSLKAIKKITYSNNTIDFIYEGKEKKRKLYPYGVLISDNKLLKNILIKTDNQEVSKYVLAYKNDRIEYITESINNKELEPIYFSWKNRTKSKPNYSSKIAYNGQKDFGQVNGWDNYQYTYYPDINGDGLLDLAIRGDFGIQIKLNSGDGKWEGKTISTDICANGSNKYGGCGDIGNHSYIRFIDMNADGLSDLVFRGDKGIQVFISNGSSLIHKTSTDVCGNWSNKYGVCNDGDNHPYIFYPDINGDGLPDLAFRSDQGIKIKLNSGDKKWEGKTISTDICANGSNKYGGCGDYGNYSTIRFVDVNADGLSDLVFRGDKGIQVFISNGSSLIHKTSTDVCGNWSSKYGVCNDGDNHQYIFYPDINGDGLPDLAFRSDQGIKIKLNSGDVKWQGEYISTDVCANGSNKYGGCGDYGNISRITFTDFDADGLFDIGFRGDIGMQGLLFDGKNFNHQVSTNACGNASREYGVCNDGDNHQTTKFIDINSDGLPDTIFRSDQLGMYSIYNSFKVYELSKITNHKDQNIEIEYSDLYDKDIYKSSTTLTYPNRSITGSPKRVVKSYSINNGIGGKNKISYKYENFAFNLERGSLGFEKVQTLAETTNTKTIMTYNQNFPFIGTVNQTETFVNNKKVSLQKNSYINVSDKLHIVKAQISNSSSFTYDYNTGNELVRKETKNEKFDQYGNIKKIITITSGNGEIFTKTVNNTYNNDESNWILSRLKESSVLHQKTDQPSIVRKSSFEYDLSTGTLNKEIIEPNNNKKLIKSYTYDKFGNKISETITGTGITSRTTTFEYDEQGKNQIKVINPLGYSEIKTYDIKNQLISLKGPNGLITSWKYDEMGRKIREDRADGTSITWSHTWDNSLPNSLYKVKEKVNYLPEIVVYYDQYVRKLRKVTTGFDGKKIYKDTQYNKIGKVSKEYIPYFENETSGEFIETTYDALGRIIKILKPDAQGKLVEYITNYNDFEIIKIDPKGNSKTTTYDALEKKIKIEDDVTYRTYKYDAIGNLILTTDVNSNKIRMNYDIFGNKINMSDPDMGHWTYEYNVLGQLIKQIDSKSQITTFKYDVLGRKIKKTQGSKVSTWTYDIGNKAIGKLQLEKSSNGIKKSYTYDNLGRVSNISTKIGVNKYLKVFAYDNFGRLDYVVEPNDFKISYSYNEYGYQDAIRTKKNKLLNFDKDKVDELLSKSSADERYYYQKYLDLKIKISKIELKLKEYKKAYASSEYIAILDDVKVLIANYKVQLLNYDKLVQKEKVKQEYYLNEINNTLIDTSTNNLQISKYTILQENAKKEVKKYETLYQNTLKLLNSEEKNLTILSKYIEEFKVIKTELVNAKNKYENILIKIDNFNQNETNFYNENYIYHYKVLKKDAFGRDIEFISGNGALTKKDYDYSGLLHSTKTGYKGDSTYFRELNYDYDENNNVISREDVKLGVTQNFLYDSIDRLTNAYLDTKNRSKHISYSYDELGNITNKSDIGAYIYSSNSPHQVVQAGSKTFTYDENGNMTNNNGTIISYNYANKPIKIEKGNSSLTFKYDMNENRFEKVLNGKITKYIGKTYEHITHRNGNIEEKYFIYVNGKVVSTQTNINDGYKIIKNTTYLHYDNLGSVDTITNNLGVVEQRMAYKPFGDRLALDKYGNEIDKSALKTNRGYTGHEHIDEFNFIHMNGRVYDPTLGRFLSADPHIQDPYDTQSYNRYTYVKNNPLKYTDPSGFFFKKIAKKIKKYIKPIIAIAVAAAITFFTAGAGGALVGAAWSSFFSGFGGMVMSGALAGFASGAIMTGSLTGALKGAVWGAVSAGVAFGVAEVVGSHSASFLNGGGSTAFRKAILHGITRAAISKAQGGRWSAGFWSGFATSGFSVGTKGYAGAIGRTTIMGIVGGTVSKISGGKFANGAVTGAFVHLFNSEGVLSKIAGGSASTATKDALSTDSSIERIAASGAKGAAAGAITGAFAGSSINEGIGTFSGAYIGARIGFSVGILKQTFIESSSWADPIYDSLIIIKDTATGYIQHNIRKLSNEL